MEAVGPEVQLAPARGWAEDMDDALQRKLVWITLFRMQPGHGPAGRRRRRELAGARRRPAGRPGPVYAAGGRAATSPPSPSGCSCAAAGGSGPWPTFRSRLDVAPGRRGGGRHRAGRERLRLHVLAGHGERRRPPLPARGPAGGGPGAAGSRRAPAGPDPTADARPVARCCWCTAAPSWSRRCWPPTWRSSSCARPASGWRSARSDLAAITALHESIVAVRDQRPLTLDLHGRVTFLNRAGRADAGGRGAGHAGASRPRAGCRRSAKDTARGEADCLTPGGSGCGWATPPSACWAAAARRWAPPSSSRT